MDELNSYFFNLLYLAKMVHDHPRLKKSWQNFDSLPLDEDAFYEFSVELATSVFQDTSVHYNEERGMETWVLSDPIIDRFCELCVRLETEKELAEEINPYRRNAEQMIRENFLLDSYSYDYGWRLSPSDRGRRCILFFSYDDFYGLSELPKAFLEILDGFQELNRQLETELGLNKIVPIYPFMNEWKEAA